MNNKIIFDGAFGTYIASKNLNLEFPELANLNAPEEVVKIHREYIACGANAIKTNTFTANSDFIKNPDFIKEIIKNGCMLAKEAVKDSPAVVFADIGPIKNETAESEYVSITDLFIAEGMTRFLFETQFEVKPLAQAISNIKNKVKNSTIIVSFAVSQDGYTTSGEYYKTLLDKAISLGADYVGLNCICGPAHMLNLVKQLDTKKYNLIAMPNAGYPTTVNGRTVYIDNPDYFAQKLFDMLSCGVSAVGGCCGTTPTHIRLFTELIGMKNLESVESSAPQQSKIQIQNTDLKKPFIAVEIGSPIDTDIDYILNAAKAVRDAGADFVTIPDSPLGKARANSFLIAALIQREASIKAIPHLCCRDKNQIAIKGDLIAGKIEEISSVLAVTGDSIPESDRNTFKNVFGFNSFRLISFIESLNQTMFSTNPYNICGALNINAVNFESELKRAGEKISAGATCLFTQPIFSQRNIDNFITAQKTLDTKIVAGVMPLAGYKNALFLNNEVAGIEIPDDIISRLKDKPPEEAKIICLTFSKKVIDQLKPYCDSFYIMTPLKKIDYSTELVKYIRRT